MIIGECVVERKNPFYVVGILSHTEEDKAMLIETLIHLRTVGIKGVVKSLDPQSFIIPNELDPTTEGQATLLLRITSFRFWKENPPPPMHQDAVTKQYLVEFSSIIDMINEAFAKQS